MTVFQGIFQSEGTRDGRGPQHAEAPAGRAARSQPSNPSEEYARFLSFQFQYLLTYHSGRLGALWASVP